MTAETTTLAHDLADLQALVADVTAAQEILNIKAIGLVTKIEAVADRLMREAPETAPQVMPMLDTVKLQMAHLCGSVQ